MAPFFYLPHTIFVAEHGLDHFDISMHAQYELTKRFSAEASIRPYIAKYPERTFDRSGRGPETESRTCAGSFPRARVSGCRGRCASHGSTRIQTASSSSSSC